MGSLITGGLGNRRSLESKHGKMFRMARLLRRKGHKKAADDFAKQAAVEKMGTPNIKTQEYRQAEEARQNQLLNAQNRRRNLMDSFLTGRETPDISDAPDEIPNPAVNRPPLRRMPKIRTMEFNPSKYRGDALAVINDPSHPQHDAETVARLMKLWGIKPPQQTE